MDRRDRGCRKIARAHGTSAGGKLAGNEDTGGPTDVADYMQLTAPSPPISRAVFEWERVRARARARRADADPAAWDKSSRAISIARYRPDS